MTLPPDPTPPSVLMHATVGNSNADIRSSLAAARALVTVLRSIINDLDERLHALEQSAGEKGSGE